MNPALAYGRLVLSSVLALPHHRLAAVGLLFLPPITMVAPAGFNRSFLLIWVAAIAGQAGWRVGGLFAGSGQGLHASLPLTRRTRLAVAAVIVLLLSIVPVCLPAVLWYGPALPATVRDWLPATVAALAGPLAALARVSPALQGDGGSDRSGGPGGASLLGLRRLGGLAAGVAILVGVPFVILGLFGVGGPVMEPTLIANWLSLPRALGWSMVLIAQMAAVMIAGSAPGLSDKQLPVFLRRLPLSPDQLARKVVAERLRLTVLLAVLPAVGVTALNLVTGANGLAAVLPHFVFGLGTAGIVSLFGGPVPNRPLLIIPPLLIYPLVFVAMAMDLGGFELSWAEMWIAAGAACVIGLIAPRLAVKNLAAVLRESAR